MKKIILKIKKWYCRLSDKKRHIELITAVLSIPMMLTVILVNFNNIKRSEQNSQNQTTPIEVIITGNQSGDQNEHPQNNPPAKNNTTPTSTPTPTPTVTPTLTPTPTIAPTNIPTATPTLTTTPTTSPTPSID